MNLDQLKLFLDVTKLGSFQQVADKNYVSQRAVSRQIKRLEAELGTQLFIRDKNKITLTQPGEFFRKRCESILNMIDATQHELHRFSYRGETKLSIGYFSPFDALFIHDLVANLPDINTFASEESVEHLVSDVLMGNLDCAIVMDNYGFDYNYHQMGLIDLTVHTDQMVIGISQQLLKHHSSILSILQTVPVVYYSNEDSSYLKQAFISSLQGQVHPTEILRVPTYEQMQMLVGTGQAISFYPQNLIVKLQTKNERITYKKIPGNNQEFNFKLIYKKENITQTLREVISYFKD